jgi:hypothetical protein
MNRADREQRLRIFETDYGRAAGWYVVHHGHRIARLTSPRHEEMFWDSYRIEPLTDDPVEQAALLTSPGWRLCEFVFRSCAFGEIAENAFAAGQPCGADHRVLMRGLYIAIGRPSV